MSASLALCGWLSAAQVTPGTGYFNRFETQPPATDWATLSRAGGANDSYDMDADVNANITAAGVTTAVAADSGNPPAANASALWSSVGQYLCVRPTGNRYTVLMGKFVNATGTNATQVTVSYQLTITGGGVAEENGRGTRVYYSLTGLTNSWVNIPALNTTANDMAATVMTAALNIEWTNGATLYLVWADDNATGNPTDSAHQIDNFSLQVTAGLPESTNLVCALTAPTNGLVVASGTAIAAAATVARGTPPYTVQWFVDDAPYGAPQTSAPFATELTGLSLGTHRVYVRAGDAGQQTAFSATNTITVLPALTVSLTAPLDGATIDYQLNVIASASVSGGTQPYSVQFLVDNEPAGNPLTEPPFTANLGRLFVGSHTVQARVRDARGWESLSPVHQITVSGPLAVQLLPNDGTRLNFGAALLLQTETGGGTAPYTLTFYTNEAVADVVRAAPYELNLGVLPVGSYTCYVHAVDSSPTTQTAYSTTNVITIRDNPLNITLTSPTNNQRVATNNVYSVSANVSVLPPVTVARVEFFFDGVSLGVDTTAPYSMVVSNRQLGTHTVYAVATDSLGRQKTSATNTLEFIIDPLANDNFVNRTRLSIPATVTGSNVGATTETGEPRGTGFFQRGASVWFSFVAPISGSVRVDTFGSSFNTTLGIYRGTAVNTLTEVAYNDNAPGYADVSLITFNATEGVEYHIQLAGAPGFGTPPATGTYVLNLSMPPVVRIVSPTNNTLFLTGEAIPISITATAAVGTLQQVELYRNGVLAATDTTAPYEFTLTNAPPGSNALVAVAVDSLGQRASSATVNVLVANLGMTITSPADGATYLSTNPITVNALAMLREGNMTNVNFYADGRWFASDSTAPYSGVWSNVSPGVHELTVVGTDEAGRQYPSPPVLIAVAYRLIPSNSVWKYLDDGSDQGTAWRELNFDDSEWESGPGQLGYGDGDEATVINSGPSGNFFITTYFRRDLIIADPAQFTNLVFQVLRDDGAVVYVNGVEAARYNMPAGPITYTTLANNAMDDGTVYYAADVSPALLRPGRNVIAVEVHQSSSTSTDVTFDLQLLGVPFIPRNKLPDVTVTQPPAGAKYLLGEPVRVEATAQDADGEVVRMSIYAGGQLLASAQGAQISFVWSNAPAGLHELVVMADDSAGGRGKSPVIPVAVFPPGNTGWRAVNDQQPGPASHPYATFYTPFGRVGGALSSGPLWDVFSGTPLAARLSVSGQQLVATTQCGAPPPGTPAHQIFGPYVDFGTYYGDNGILMYGQGQLVHEFSGLNPARKYRLRATVVGGNAAYANWWTLFALEGATAFAGAHTANVLTQGQYPLVLQAHQAAMAVGDNRTGDVIGWDEIVPSAAGRLRLISSLYSGPVPGGQVPSPLTYAPVAVMLEEAGGPAPLVWLTAPTNGWVEEGPLAVTLQAEALAYDAVSRVDFVGNNQVLASIASAPYRFTWTNAPFGTNTVMAVACGASGAGATSAPVSFVLTVPPPNELPPTVAYVYPPPGTVTNLTRIQVIFSEKVVGVDAADLLINGVPATNMTGSGSNYVFYFPQPAFGNVGVQWSSNHNITDLGWPIRLEFYEFSAGATWDYVLADLTPPTIVAKNPPAGASLTNLTQVTVTFSEPVAGVDAADFLVNNVPAYDVQQQNLTNYTFFFSQPASGTVNISWAVNHGITDRATPPNNFNRTGSGATWSYTLDAKTILIPSNSLWRFVKGTQEASDPREAWRQFGFDDSGWSNAPAPFFFGDPYSNGVPAYTLLDDMRSNYTSIYLRRPFVVPNPTAVTNLYLRAIMDDGMVVWINGVEVLRYNVPAGDLAYDATASSAIMEQNGLPYTNYALLDPRLYLRAGTNIIAVHALNESLSASSDFCFNAELFTYIPNTELEAPRLVQRLPDATYLFALTNITVVFSEPVTNVQASDLLINGQPAASVSSPSNHIYIFSFPQPPYGPVTVAWVANHGIVDLDLVPKPFTGGTWQHVLLNPDLPYVTAVTPAAGSRLGELTQIALTFSEPVQGVKAGDLLINGTPAAAVSGGGAQYVFTFPQPAYGSISVTFAENHQIRDFAASPNRLDVTWPAHTWSYTLVDMTPPVLAGIQPPPNTMVTGLTQITVTFSEPVSGVTANDLLINGRAARTVTGSNAVYTFTFPQPNASQVTVTWAANHGIRDLAATPNNFDAAAPGASWVYLTPDNLPPSLASVSPGPNLRVRSLKRIRVTFDEPVTGVDAADLRVNNQPALSVSGTGAGPYEFVLPAVSTGVVNVAWAAGHGIRDVATPANSFAGGSWTYTVEPGLPGPFAVKHVILISVDGLGSVYLSNYIYHASEYFPNFTRLFTEGSSTLNARNDYTQSETVPNHSSMLTGRPVAQPEGWDNTTHHGVTFNSDNGLTIHVTGNTAVPYKSSPFDVAHDYGLSTAFLYSKQSLTFLARSWSTGGGADLIGTDNGSNKIDRLLSSVNAGNYGPSSALVDELVGRIAATNLWNFTFMHWTELDQYGHQAGWGSATYSNQMRNLDEQMGRLLDALLANPEVGRQTVIIVTADHGGTGIGHADPANSTIYSIPLCFWGAGIAAGGDPYQMFSNRANPGSARYNYNETRVLLPLYNGDCANLSVTLLGLPQVPGSSLMPVFGPKPVSLVAGRSQGAVQIVWPDHEALVLQVSPALGPQANWQPVTQGITLENGLRIFRVMPQGGTPPQFYRLVREN
ncbi:MAG: Ig-like domain-containing protein [Verrucomicrobiae bacterium]|nr:Ig-like domain-containing protein [Verrucomicrobiae bacterium]